MISAVAVTQSLLLRADEVIQYSRNNICLFRPLLTLRMSAIERKLLCPVLADGDDSMLMHPPYTRRGR